MVPGALWNESEVIASGQGQPCKAFESTLNFIIGLKLQFLADLKRKRFHNVVPRVVESDV